MINFLDIELFGVTLPSRFVCIILGLKYLFYASYEITVSFTSRDALAFFDFILLLRGSVEVISLGFSYISLSMGTWSFISVIAVCGTGTPFCRGEILLT